MTLYQSQFDGNLNNEPDLFPGAWSTVVTTNDGSTNWRPLLTAQLQSIDLLYPVGTGPASQKQSLNLFMLPNGFLREAQQNLPGGPTWLGGPSGNFASDWQFEGDFLVSSSVYPIVLRFVADVSDVVTMNDMFCEGLAARLAMEVCETLTQSSAKLQTIGAVYKVVMGEARTVNAIETGSDEPPEDDFLLVRY